MPLLKYTLHSTATAIYLKRGSASHKHLSFSAPRCLHTACKATPHAAARHPPRPLSHPLSLGHAHHCTWHTGGSTPLPGVPPTPRLLPTVTHALFSACKSLATLLLLAVEASSALERKEAQCLQEAVCETLSWSRHSASVLVSPRAHLCLFSSKCAQRLIKRKCINAMKCNSRWRVKKKIPLLCGVFLVVLHSLPSGKLSTATLYTWGNHHCR